MKQPKRRGRPLVERRRVPMTMRVTPALHDELTARAEETGRSLTQEAEFLLEHAVISEKTMGSKAWRIGVMVTLNFGRAVEDVPELDPWNTLDMPKEPLDNPVIYREGLIRSIEVLTDPVADIDGVFAAARERIEQKRSGPSAQESTLRAMAASARKSDR
jgi:hypothetical protein